MARVKRKRYHLNVEGDFYVEDGCCTLCGVPGVLAPQLFGGFEADGSIVEGVEQCWVMKQPATPAEVEAMLHTMGAQEFDCIRYVGTDASVIALLQSSGEGGSIDR